MSYLYLSKYLIILKKDLEEQNLGNLLNPKNEEAYITYKIKIASQIKKSKELMIDWLLCNKF